MTGILDFHIRFSEASDKEFVVKWLKDPAIYSWFPVDGDAEVEDAANLSLAYARINAALTATYKGAPVGFAHLYLNSLEALKHQCLFSIIVAPDFRGKGIGSALIERLIKMAREDFSVRLLHLEVYEKNPAMHLYERMGFKKYGEYPRFLKEGDVYQTKVLMELEL